MLPMKTRVSHQKTCLHYNKSNQSCKKPKKFFYFATESNFSFTIIDRFSVTSIFSFDWFKLSI